MPVYVCPKLGCDLTTSSLRCLVVHYRHVHWPESFCPVCGKSAPPDTLLKHITSKDDMYHRALAYLVGSHRWGCKSRRARAESARRLFKWPGVKFAAEERAYTTAITIIRIMPPPGPDGFSHDDVARVLKAIASPRRIRILRELARGPKDASELARALYGRPHYRVAGAVQHHLRKLMDAGLIVRGDQPSWMLTKRGYRVLKLIRQLHAEV